MRTILLSCLLLAAIGVSPVSGQFSDAIDPESPVGMSNITSQNIGNDIMDYGGVTYEVTVWDDSITNQEGMSWDVGTYSGNVIFSSFPLAKDPDVVLVNNNAGSVYALVAFYSQITQQFVLETFQWMTASHTFVSIQATPLATGSFATAINIDANENGDFGIIWDEPGFAIKMAAGQVTNGGSPTLHAASIGIPLAPGSFPDIAMYYNSSGDNQVDVSFLTIQGIIAVDFINLSTIITGSGTVIGGYRSPAPDLIYKNPRIACPAGFMSNKADFTVVCEDTDGSNTWYIKAFNQNACCNPLINITIFNDGGTGFSPFDLTDIPNTKPVVTYDDTYSSTRVAWLMDNTSALLSSAGAQFYQYPISVTCDRKAKIIFNQEYLAVPSNMSGGFQSNKISIAGRGSTKALFSFHHSPNGDIYTKSVDHLPYPTHLRMSSYDNLQQFLNNSGAYSDELLLFILHDITGREVARFTATHHDITQFLNTIELKPSIYLVQINDTSGNIILTEKVISLGNYK